MRVRQVGDSAAGAEVITCEWSNKAHLDSKAQQPYRWHSHLRGQLLCIQSGVVQIKTVSGTWVLPPNRAGWIPPGAQHSILFCSEVSGYSVLFQPNLCEALPGKPYVLGVNPLLKSMIIRSQTWCKDLLTEENMRIADVMTDEIRNAESEKLYLPMPRDSRLLRIAEAVLNEPGSPKTVEQWAEFGALSARSLRRLMPAETGLTFAQWRTQVQLNHALALLSQNVPVGDVAFSLGYTTTSNFIAMFKKMMGDSPAHYFSRTKEL
ncbi:AraC family transcriptional regulator [Marinomonas ostreistagni]|uniref:Helix-turn-helix transcriptional regulator n=1 Tax=Marinomonas ostreistagni TaxID=359209 RepID=A0ABS0ZEX2_9GAMM|nr:helix-turn-helix transcriptional regulator [Marinomonas ostreistagni]MBJ7551708.1 helix-turn-helix transcriptional regulator [Marinomonas ostreistagni]